MQVVRFSETSRSQAASEDSRIAMTAADPNARQIQIPKDANMSKAITCRELIDFLNDYIEARLEDPMRESFERHLGACSHCREYLATYRQTIALARGAWNEAEADVARDVPEDIVRAVLEARQASSASG
jgi:anti-sigma factor RsiW